jgi:hypothetical protein
MFHKITGNLEKNAGNRGHNIIFFPLCPDIILIVKLKRIQKTNWGKMYDIFSPRVFIVSPLGHAIIFYFHRRFTGGKI